MTEVQLGAESIIWSTDKPFRNCLQSLRISGPMSGFEAHPRNRATYEGVYSAGNPTISNSMSPGRAHWALPFQWGSSPLARRSQALEVCCQIGRTVHPHRRKVFPLAVEGHINQTRSEVVEASKVLETSCMPWLFSSHWSLLERQSISARDQGVLSMAAWSEVD